MKTLLWLMVCLLLPFLSACQPDEKSAGPAPANSNPQKEEQRHKPPGEEVVAPSIYLLNHQHWTPVLVLNFANEVAPLDRVGKEPLEAIPSLDPPMAGQWRWQDPSRLVFQPKNKTFQPETTFKISLDGLKLRPDYRLASQTFTYHTPPLTIVRLECRWHDILIAPMRRQLEAAVEFNYAVSYPPFQATVGANVPVALHNGSGSKIVVDSDVLLRPAEDTALNFHANPGTVSLLYQDYQGQYYAGAPATLSKGADCQLPALRSAWDKIEEKPLTPPTVTSIGIGLNQGKLEVRLQGHDLTESAKKVSAGEEVKSGITISPNAEGIWRYGESAGGADLLFTPATPETLTPGTTYEIVVAKDVFPKLVFDKLTFSVKYGNPGMSVSIENLQLYSDLVDPKIKRVTARLSFNYPPRKDSLSAETSVRLREEPAKSFDDSRVKSIPFDLVYDDKNPRLAYLKTAPITIPNEPGEIMVRVGGGLVSSLGGEPGGGTDRSLAIPSAKDYLKVTEASTESVIRNNGDIERLLILQTTVPLVEPSALAKAVEAYVLPDCREENLDRPALCEQKSVEEWVSPDQVDEATLKLSSPVPMVWRDPNQNDKTIQFLTFQAPEKRQLFVKVKRGIESVDGFKLAKDARFLLGLGANQRELKILHDGALLSLTGTKKLGVAVRGVNKIQIELKRVLPHNMHHFAQFTRGDFQNPDFKLPIEHFAETFSYEESMPAGKEMQRQYFAVDFARFAQTKGYPPHGLFLLKIAEKKDKPAEASEPCASDDAAQTGDEESGEIGEEGQNGCADKAASNTEESEDSASESGTDEQDASATEADEALIKDQRLVLLTDLGLLVKTAADGHQDVFVMSFRSGQPVAGAQISLLGMNGIPLASAKSNAQGQVSFPSVEGLKDEKAPSVYLAEKDGDLSFLPYSRNNRLLDVSRFDVDGLHDAADSLHAFVFSDRGIYRPGDQVHIGLILRKRDWSSLPAGLPLKAVITDPQDQEIWSETVAFGLEGFETLDWTSPEAGKTGTYRVELFLPQKDDKSQKTKTISLGATTIRVEEFQPDRLQVKTEIQGAQAMGWLKPEGAKATVTVRNLFGTPAVGNPAKLEMTIRPWLGQVPGFPKYRFRGTFEADIAKLPQDLGEVNTDAQGIATFDLPLSNINEPIFEINLAGEGFEKDSGRSVVNVASTLVSRQSSLLGIAADGSLDYIPKGSARKLKLLMVGADFKPKEAAPISAEIFERRFISTLVKRGDGLYAYQSVQRDEPRGNLPVSLTDGKGELALPTGNPGRFYVVFKNAQGEELNRADYDVAGEGNVTRNIERNAELNLTLNKKEYPPGEPIEVQIVAPYQGAGLMTIEQNGVVASQWIKTNSASSTHRITLPKSVSGNAYLSVAFVRSLDSREIYMSPLSYGVVPFAISRQAYQQEVTLDVPEKVRPGHNLEVHYRARESTKLVIYAVDEGILQFAHYRNPAPLDFFFRKRALQTKTHQILDLILPDYALVRKLSATGGDEDAETFGKYKNPFARKHKPPLAFWSGILDAGPAEQVLSIPVPDYFNGSIRVLAVAVNAGKLAVPVSRTVASNPYVIQPQQPLAVAPGDEFDMGVLVANNTGENGDKTLEVSVNAGDALELQSPNPQTLTLGPGKDGTVRFKAKAREKLGPIELRYQVSGGGREAGYSEEMSIRPSQPLLTTMRNGVLRIVDQQAGKTAKLDLERKVYDEQRFAEFSVSMTPAAYLRGIVEYLKHYPYGCTEQLVSQAFPAVVLGGNVELGLSTEDVDRLFKRTMKILQARLKHDGSFAYWSIAGPSEPLYSMYATHLLLEARERGQRVLDTLFDRAIHYADQYTQERHYYWREHEAQAYALYLLSRNGQVVADRLKAFEAELDRQWGQGWQREDRRGEPAANWVRFLLGASYKLQHLDQDADRFFGEFQRQWKKSGLLPWNLQNDPEMMSLYLYLLNKHFSKLVDTQDPQFGRYLLELGQDMVKQRTNSFRGSWALLGLGSLWNRFEHEDGKSFRVNAGQPPISLALEGMTVKRVELERMMTPVAVSGEGVWNLYYQLTERGYDKAAPTTAISQSITINRELLNEKGEKARELDLQDKLHIRFALHPDRAMKNLAVVMLIPGGFEIDLSEEGLGARKSLPIKDKPLWEPEYIDVQEDRVVFFGALDSGEKYFEFRLKPLNTGTYTVPPVFAEGMYDTEIQYRGLAESIRVKD